MTAFVDALGWTLLHFLWQGALIGLATAAVLALLRHTAPQQRYLVACVGLLLCAGWPASQFALRLQGDMAVHDAYPALAPTGTAIRVLVLKPYMTWIVAAWSAGSLAFALRSALGLAWIGRAARLGGRDPAWQARLTQLAQAMGVRRPVRLRVVARLASPVTALWWRPVVLVPASLLSGLPPELLQALLAHELAHVRRHDYLVNLLQNAVETVLFYHPAVWWLSRRIRHERELIADAIAAEHAGGPRRLAIALSELEKRQFTHPEPALAANGGNMMDRITRLLRPAPRPHRGANFATALPALALAAACAAGLAQANVDAPVEKPDHRAVVNLNSCDKPVWPAAALAAQQTGTVTLRFLIDGDGNVADSRVHKSSGHESLDEAARSGIAKCHFKPAVYNGKPVKAWVMMQYVWTLE
ncbi:M56 family metallopeptidase [Pseudoduganella armeniaca]|uniref:Peptidase M56 n=1 Tax=Pseudoduganella armeniaca TaxID=2072590 RepID=A0A2R4CGG2_9BURK|nr:M56 family metallopeptidase [Pseudoduganella armeniaca]AVR98622.1 peptidase M56 [Pseudoduganella armeniaca]